MAPHQGIADLVHRGQGRLLVRHSQDFGCAEVLVEEIPIEGIDATLFVNVSMAGTFLNATTTSGESTGSASCEGTNCDWLEDFPCSMVREFTGTAD